jgi:apolipoprotein N-acyltransferase
MRYKKILLALASGLMTALCFPKFNLIFLAWICLLPMFLIILEEKPAGSFVFGWIAGLVFYGILLYWIPAVPAHYGGLSDFLSFLVYLILILFLGLFWAVFAFLSTVLRRAFPRLIFILIPFLWVSLEYAITHFLTGFPWGLLGSSQTKNLYLIQTASLTGVYGISFVLVLFQSLFLASVKLRMRSPFFLALAFVFLVHTAGYLTVGDIPSGGGPPFKGAVIQGNVSSDIFWDTYDTRDIYRLFERHMKLTRQAASAGARIIFWPEFSVPLCLSCPAPLYQDLGERLKSFVRESQVSLLVGSNETAHSKDGGEIYYYNTAVQINPDLSQSLYHKNHLVPFGEYTPYKRIFSFIQKITNSVGELTPGHTLRLHSWDGLDYGSPICYEIIFPNLVRKFAARGASFLVTITNDAWFGSSAAPRQHFSIAILRAVENRRYLLRAATTGISGVIDPYGRIVARTELNTEAALTETIFPIQTATLYTLWGDWFPLSALTISALFLILAWTATRRRKQS